MIALTIGLWVQVAVSLACLALGMLGRIGMFWGFGTLAIGNAVITAVEVAGAAWGRAAFNAFIAVACALSAWWSWRHRKRRRAPRALGAKARARIAAMVTRMRERPARPALRPVHGGAR